MEIKAEGETTGIGSERQAAIVFALIRTLFCAYRAATQSFVHDEAFSFANFINVHWHNLYHGQDANNHLLFSVLAKTLMAMFGDFEFVIRLPTVAAGFFLILGIWMVLERVRSRTVRWVAFAAFWLHPLVLDFSVAARGYGLAMAFLLWAIVAILNRHYAKAGFLLGFAVSANFTFAFPAAGLICAIVVTGQGSLAERLRRMTGMTVRAAGPILIICGGVLKKFHAGSFYVGYPSLRDSVADLIYKSIFASRREGIFGTAEFAQILASFGLPLILLFIAVTSCAAWRRGDRESLAPATALGVALATMIAAHHWFGLNYPIDRTGLWVVLLFGVSWAIAAGNQPNRLSLAMNTVLAAALTAQFATQLHTDYFQIWPYDRSAKTIMRLIEGKTRGRTSGSVSLGATWMYQPALEYYRVRDNVAVLRPIMRHNPPELTETTGHDFYVLSETDRLAQNRPSSAIVFTDAFAGVALLE